MKELVLAVAWAVLLGACNSEGKAKQDRQAAPAASSESAAAALTLDKLFELSGSLKLPAEAFGGWTGSGHEHFASQGSGDATQLMVVDAASGKFRPFHDAARMESALASVPGVDAATAKSLAHRANYEFSKNGQSALFNSNHDLIVYHFDSSRAVRLTEDAAEEVGEVLSPDGQWVSFVRDSNLFVVSSNGGEVRQLTSEGDETHLFGRLDWVYQEEVYGRGNFQAHWWSPDSSRIAFLALDESDVPEYTIADTRERHPKLEVWRYPKAGDSNPTARLGVVDAAGGNLTWFDLADYPTNLLIVRVGWTPDSKSVVAQLQDRRQTWLDLCLGDPASGKLRRLFRDSTPAWIMPIDEPCWLEGSDQFLWLSERDGYQHLYLYGADGALVRQVTKGPWEVDFLRRVDAKKRVAWVGADREDVKGNQLFEIQIDGGEPKLLTREAGTHDVAVSPDGAYFVDSFSSHASAPVQTMHEIAGKQLRELARVDGAPFAATGIVAPEFHKPKARDGFELEGMLYKPASFDPSRKYALMCFTYSGPNAPQVRDTFYTFNGLFNQLLVQQGCLVWVCDNRSASGKGLASAANCYKRFGAEELADLEDGIDYLAKQGFVDPARIGIWGWSFGGYMSAFALTHSSRFKLGIAGAPVTDWRLYDSIYTERYMGLPSENEAGYDAGSVVAAAKNLHGRLLVICGEIDENVHAQNSLQLAAALQKAGKPFEFMVYPGNRHGIVDPDQRRHLYAMMADYVKKNL